MDIDDTNMSESLYLYNTKTHWNEYTKIKIKK